MELVSGDPCMHPLQFFLAHYGPFAHVAELGCGDGVFVHFLLHADPNLKVDAYDVSLERSRALVAPLEGAVERSKFVRIDLNDTLLAPIFGSGCLDSVMATSEEG
jgi:methylase of polypeptide subunit release factors